MLDWREMEVRFLLGVPNIMSFSDLLKDMFVERTPKRGPRRYNNNEVITAGRNMLIENALSAIRHYKNTSPKYIIGKMGVIFGGSEDMKYYEGVEGNAKVLTELIMQGVIALNSDGQLYIVKE